MLASSSSWAFTRRRHYWLQLTIYWFIDSERKKSWVGLIGLPAVDGLCTQSGIWVSSPVGVQRDVPLCHATNHLRPVYSDTTQLNLTAWTTVDSVCRSWRHKQKHDWLGCTLFNWVSWVEFSCVAINTPLLDALLRRTRVLTHRVRLHWHTLLNLLCRATLLYQ